ncbi:MAG: hypothetical protein R2856_10475 [Caldilineaceae bacterium]
MSYVVHDAVALSGMSERLPELCRRWRHPDRRLRHHRRKLARAPTSTAGAPPR